MTSWHIVTGEYPPQLGGISDYTRLVARGFAQAGDDVHVWCPKWTDGTPIDSGVKVHRLPGHFGLRSLTALSKKLNKYPRPRHLLVQYVPQAYGLKGMNVAFCLWLLFRRRDDTIWTMFHEVYFPIGRNQSMLYNTLGAITRLMALIVARASRRIFVSIPAWEDLLHGLVRRHSEITWLPLPSGVPVTDDPVNTRTIRERFLRSPDGLIIGHFGTFGRDISEMLIAILPPLLVHDSLRVTLLVGRGGEEARDALLAQYPNLSGQIHATGSLRADDASPYLRACDVMVQPFIDGVSTRRTSLMASLAHGLPIVTNTGELTEPLWGESKAVVLSAVGDRAAVIEATERLLADASERTRLGQAAALLYQERFDVKHVIERLRTMVTSREDSMPQVEES